ncbi:stalk domain-containing protein [Peptoniphilus hominis (ex Hitch et al. 2025)]|uniref:Stalk domain-containing protein n=1 Tax=Peptoniphilus hominis (ex Hitch et al. 2025) TaxID=3133174 RepID=A0ABV1CBP6_9FIRM
MKKVVATTMATLLFGLSIPVNSFALPNNTEGLESNKIEDFNVKKFSGRIIDRDPNFRLAGENNRQQSADSNRQMPVVINSNNVGGVKPEGYVTVTYKVDASMGKFQIGGNVIPEFELKYFVDPRVGVQLSDVSSVSPLVTDTSKYKLDEKNPWIIEPNSTNMQSEVKGDITLRANITKIVTGTPNPSPSIADRIGKNNLIPVDISLWQGDPINWKDGVELDTSVNDPELRRAFEEANFKGDNRDSVATSTKGSVGNIVVTFIDNSSITVNGQKLFVFPHVTASSFTNTPKDAVETTFLLGEGTKAGDGQDEKVGNAEHPVPYKTYMIKPGTNVHNFLLPTNKNIFDNISAKPVDDSYSDLKWEPENYIVNENNKSFTARAIKSYKVKFEFKAYDTDNGNSDIKSLPKDLMDKLPKEVKVKKGDAFDAPTKPKKFVETLKDNSGEITKVYEWTFSSWNPTRINNSEKDETITGTWTRKQVTSAKPTGEKATEGDKAIKGQGIAGSIIKIKQDNKTVDVKVSDTGKWEAKLDRELNKDEKFIITQVEKGKKESEQVELTVAKKENNKPNPKPEQKSSPNKRPRTGNIFPKLKNRDYNKNSIEVKTYLAKSKIYENKGIRHIINVLSGEYEIVKDGVSQKKKMDVKPVIKNDRLMLPLRSLAEMIGAKVEWNSQTRVATFINNGLVAKIQIDGNEIVLSNGKVIKMDSKPLNINGRILVSLSNVANVFGLTNGNTKDGIDQDIEWDDANKAVTINLKK